MLNWEPLVQGPASVRSGTIYVAEVKDSAAKTRLIPFEFSTLQAYVIEFSNLFLRFYMDQGQILSGTPYQVASPWATADLFTLKYSQSIDVLYITHADYKTRKVSRTGHTSWTITEFDFTDGPYLNVNATATTLTPSGTTGSITVTASAITGINANTGFQTTDIGRLIRFKDSAANWTWLKITARASTTSVTATVSGADLATTTATALWRLGVWSDTTGWPTCSVFADGRFWLAGGTDTPQALAASVSDDFENFAPSDPDGTVTDDASIVRFLNANKVNAIYWLDAHDKGVIIGTAGGAWTASAGGTTEEVITPTNIKVKRIQPAGSADVQPVQVDLSTIFVQRATRTLRELAYVFEADGYKAPNISIFNEAVTKQGIAALAYHGEPQPYLLALTTDGVMVKTLYDREQDAVGICRTVIAGTDAEIESVAVIPASDGLRDEVWVAVKRTVDGATVRYVEYFSSAWEEGDAATGAHYVDSGLVYNGTAATAISGLDHLEGESVTLLVDGAVHPSKTVVGGAITLDYAGSIVHAGLGYTADLQLLRPEAGAQDGTAQGKIKKVDEVIARFMDTGGLLSGRDASNLYRVTFRTSADPLSQSVPLYTGDKELPFQSDYTTDGFVFIRQDQPLPATVLAIMPRVVTADG